MIIDRGAILVPMSKETISVSLSTDQTSKRFRKDPRKRRKRNREEIRHGAYFGVRVEVKRRGNLFRELRTSGEEREIERGEFFWEHSGPLGHK